MSNYKGRSRCESVRESLGDFLDGHLSPALRGPLRAHLQRCPACRTAFDREERLRKLLSDMDHSPAPTGFEERVLATVYAQVPLRERVAPRTARHRRPQWVLLPLAMIVLVLALSQWFRPPGGNQLRDTATVALVEGSRELTQALGGLEVARATGEHLARPALDKAASLLRVERTLLSVLPGNFIALILLVGASPLVLLFTVYRVRLKGAMSHVLVHPTLR